MADWRHVVRARLKPLGLTASAEAAPSQRCVYIPLALHVWVFGTKTFQKMAGDFAGSLIGDAVGRGGIDDDFAARGFDNVGAWITGRNMFGPSRGAWPDDGWKVAELLPFASTSLRG